MTHVILEEEVNSHEQSMACKCNPSIRNDDGEIWVFHKSLFGQEGINEANRILGNVGTIKEPCDICGGASVANVHTHRTDTTKFLCNECLGEVLRNI